MKGLMPGPFHSERFSDSTADFERRSRICFCIVCKPSTTQHTYSGSIERDAGSYSLMVLISPRATYGHALQGQVRTWAHTVFLEPCVRRLWGAANEAHGRNSLVSLNPILLLKLLTNADPLFHLYFKQTISQNRRTHIYSKSGRVYSWRCSLHFNSGPSFPGGSLFLPKVLLLGFVAAQGGFLMLF
jgi:hypothetical protein